MPWSLYYINSMTYYPFLSVLCFEFSFFCYIFSIFIHVCLSRIWMDKSSFLNHSIFFVFKSRQLSSLYNCYYIFFFFTIINNSFSEWLDCGTFWYVVRKTKKFSERNSINKLFLKFKIEGLLHCFKTRILNIILTLASDLPQKIVLLNYIDSKMIRKDFRSTKESISASLLPTDWRRLYSSLRAKSIKVFMNKN